MFRMFNPLFDLSDLLIIEFEIKEFNFKDNFYMLPLIKWEDNRYSYFYSMLFDNEGNIMDYLYGYEVQEDIGGMFQ